MVKRGVLFILILLNGFSTYPSQKEKESDDIFNSLFSDTDHSVSSHPTVQAIIVDDFLDDSPQMEQEFRALSLEDKEALLELIDLVNKAFSEGLYELVDEVLEMPQNVSNDLQETHPSDDCDCLSLLA